MCRGRTITCRQCRRNNYRYTERCSQEEFDLYPNVPHRMFGRTFFTRQCASCRREEEIAAERRERDQIRIQEVAKHVVEYLAGEHQDPLDRQALENAFREGRRLHPYSGEQIPEIQARLAYDPNALLAFNRTVRRQQELDLARRSATHQDLEFSMQVNDPITDIELQDFISSVRLEDEERRDREAREQRDMEAPGPSRLFWPIDPPIPITTAFPPSSPLVASPSNSNNNNEGLSPLNFCEWIAGQQEDWARPLADEASLTYDIERYDRYVRHFRDSSHTRDRFLELVTEIFSLEGRTWDFVPTLTPQITTQLMSFREWHENNPRSCWRHYINGYAAYLQANGTREHVASFTAARERTARNSRRWLNMRTGGEHEEYEPDTCFVEENDHENFDEEDLEDYEDTEYVEDSVPDRNLLFREWVERSEPQDSNLSLSEALERDVDAYGNEYLGRYGTALELHDFQMLRRRIRNNEEASFNFQHPRLQELPVSQEPRNFRDWVVLSAIALDYDWERAVSEYPNYLRSQGLQDLIPLFQEARDNQARADRREYERQLREEDPEDSQEDDLTPLLQESRDEHAQPNQREDDELEEDEIRELTLPPLRANSLPLFGSILYSSPEPSRRPFILPVAGHPLPGEDPNACPCFACQDSLGNMDYQVPVLPGHPRSEEAARHCPCGACGGSIPGLQITPPDEIEIATNAIREQISSYLSSAAQHSAHLVQATMDLPRSSSRATVLRALQTFSFYIAYFRNHIPSGAELSWIETQLRNIEMVLDGEMDADRLDMNGPPADEGDLVTATERQRRARWDRDAERAERRRANWRGRTPDPEDDISEAGDEDEDEME